MYSQEAYFQAQQAANNAINDEMLFG
jgi:hypothetical protein